MSTVSDGAEAHLPLSGQQVHLAAGGYEADIATVGASLRRLTLNGRDLVVPFEADEVRPWYRGVLLVPWPNRVIDAAYDLPGLGRQQLAITEPDRGHALHGLGLWLDWVVLEQTPSAALFSLVIEPQVGYPFRLIVMAAYTLSADGLETVVQAVNAGPGVAPYGTGPHPYVVAGPSPLNQWTFTLPAGQVMTVTPDRLIPTGLAPVAGTEFDFQAGKVIGETFIDHAFTGLTWDEAGHVTATVTDPAAGTGVAVTWDKRCPWVQIHTADQPDPAINRLGLALEPMTCPPGAFNSGTDVVWLEEDAHHTAAWTISGW
ncbi:MAG: aldose 1-epimerase family protein [Bifidobacteriaceae bacterium]|jgi:aldose 1-epimerase|nr:aldose 1-epimerase family protein [Bifidobacteriaceae bacterium]